MNEGCRETEVFHDWPTAPLRGTQRECRTELKKRGLKGNVGPAAVDDYTFSEDKQAYPTIFKRLTTSSWVTKSRHS